MQTNHHSTPSGLITLGNAARIAVALAFALLLLSIPLMPGTAFAAKSVTWKSFDVRLELQNDGSYHVTERQEIAFSGGVFSGGFATLPLDKVDGIKNIQISEISGRSAEPYDFVSWSRFDESPQTYSYNNTGSEIEVGWGFDQTRNDTRVFILEYDVVGALRVYGTGTDARQQIWWTAISSDVTGAGAVDNASVTLVLPAAVDPATALLGDDAEEIAAEHTSDGKTWTWTKRNLGEGDEFIVRLEFPALVDAEAPGWQQADDTKRLEEVKSNDRQSLYDLVFLGIGLLFTVVGIAGVYGLWYTKGRDPHVGLVAEFLPQPPDDLPPGAVGALLDEVANERDIVATIVDFGRRGVIRIEEATAADRSSPYGAADFTLTLLDASIAKTQFEQSLLASLFGPKLETNESVMLSQARSGFAASAETIKTNMYNELVSRNYFTHSPEQTRSRWRSGAIIALVIFVVASCLGGGLVSSISAFVFFPLGIVALIILVIVFLSRVLPKKTAAGAEAAAKWRSFEKYLRDIEKYDKLSESQQIFDKYLAYAVAFGLEEGWVRKFSSAGATPPRWYGPVIISGPRDWSQQPRTHPSYGGGTIWNTPRGSSSSSGSGGMNIPGMQEMSDSAGRSVQGGSDSFFRMLGSAAKAFGDISTSSGSSRRHWGGSGGGFSGGGHRGGSSGGGKRGFH